MIKTLGALRRKFIIITMCSILAVLTGIVTVMNIMNYRNIVERADQRIEFLARDPGNIMNDLPPKYDFSDRLEMNPETPFDSRFFTVRMTDTGEVKAVDLGRIASVDVDHARSYAEKLFENEKNEGFADNYRYKKYDTEDGLTYIFLDFTRELDTFRSFLLSSVTVSIGGVIAVFLLVLILSKHMIKPFYESYEKQKRFITDAGHEIKTPLTVIDACVEVIEMENGEGEWTESIKKQIRRLAGLTERLVILSKMQEDGRVIKRAEFSMSDTVLETADSFFSVAKAQGKQISLDVDESITILGEEASIRQLVGLLIDNAVKYSSSSAEISVKLCLRPNGKGCILTVKNPTEGVSKGNKSKWLERFYREDSSRNSELGGYGIGLSVAAEIVDSHKGSIEVCSEDGNSVKVTVTL